MVKCDTLFFNATTIDSQGNPLYNSPIDWTGLAQKYGPQVVNQIKGLVAKGGGAGGTNGGGILNSILGNPGDAAFNSLPFLLALNEANRQENIYFCG